MFEEVSSYASSILFNPGNYDGVYISTSSKIIETRNLGHTWETLKLEQNSIDNSSNIQLQVFADTVYASTDTSIYKLTETMPFLDTTDCLFNWAERQYSSLFSPASSHSEKIQDYTYRYYAHTSTYRLSYI